MLKKLKKFRKAFLTNFLRIHYSQFGEDVILKELLGKQKNGFYVDVGCYHPKKFSNTYFLYRRGWRGINIDMEEHKIDLFELARKKDINIVAAVSDKNEVFSINKKRSYDLGAALCQEKIGGLKVRTKTLNEIISTTEYENKPIDLLTVDAEGHDLNVLKSLSFAVYKPKIVVVEIHATDIEDILKSEINALLLKQAYRLRSWAVFSLIYVRQS